MLCHLMLLYNPESLIEIIVLLVMIIKARGVSKGQSGHAPHPFWQTTLALPPTKRNNS